jgi:predicted amidophosphoribosyltransferase
VRESESCRECQGRTLAFARAWSPFAYEGVCRRVVGALKSRGAVSVAGYMGWEISRRSPGDLLRGALIPVPVHPRRRRVHGFNPALEISRGLGRATELPIRDVLVRVGRSPPQVGLERRDRLANARLSVEMHSRKGAPARAVLVDDVYTTGATLDACARALRSAGAREVVALTFARAVRG